MTGVVYTGSRTDVPGIEPMDDGSIIVGRGQDQSPEKRGMGETNAVLTAGDQKEAALDDDTENALDLNEIGTLSIVQASASKWGDGLSGFSSSDFLKQTSQSLNVTGDLSITVAFSIDSLDTDSRILVFGGDNQDETEPENFTYSLQVRSDGSLAYVHESGAGNNSTRTSAANTVSTGEHSVTLRRDTTNKTIVVKLDGTEVINDTYTDNPSGGSDGDFRAGAQLTSGSGANPLSGSLFEIRIWNQLIDQSELDDIADPDNSRFDKSAQGDELALYLMEADATVQWRKAVLFDRTLGDMDDGEGVIEATATDDANEFFKVRKEVVSGTDHYTAETGPNSRFKLAGQLLPGINQADASGGTAQDGDIYSVDKTNGQWLWRRSPSMVYQAHNTDLGGTAQGSTAWFQLSEASTSSSDHTDRDPIICVPGKANAIAAEITQNNTNNASSFELVKNPGAADETVLSSVTIAAGQTGNLIGGSRTPDADEFVAGDHLGVRLVVGAGDVGDTVTMPSWSVELLIRDTIN